MSKDPHEEQMEEGWSSIVTQYRDRHGDFLKIFVTKEVKGILITDDAYILTDLRMCGHSVDETEKEVEIEEILENFGARRDGDEISIRATEESFWIQKDRLCQAILVVEALFHSEEALI